MEQTLEEQESQEIKIDDMDVGFAMDIMGEGDGSNISYYENTIEEKVINKALEKQKVTLSEWSFDYELKWRAAFFIALNKRIEEKAKKLKPMTDSLKTQKKVITQLAIKLNISLVEPERKTIKTQRVIKKEDSGELTSHVSETESTKQQITTDIAAIKSFIKKLTKKNEITKQANESILIAFLDSGLAIPEDFEESNKKGNLEGISNVEGLTPNIVEKIRKISNMEPSLLPDKTLSTEVSELKEIIKTNDALQRLLKI